jgi:hypothetical protein
MAPGKLYDLTVCSSMGVDISQFTTKHNWDVLHVIRIAVIVSMGMCTNEVIRICNSCSRSWELYYWNLPHILQPEELMSLCIIWELIHMGIV